MCMQPKATGGGSRAAHMGHEKAKKKYQELESAPHKSAADRKQLQVTSYEL